MAPRVQRQPQVAPERQPPRLHGRPRSSRPAPPCACRSHRPSPWMRRAVAAARPWSTRPRHPRSGCARPAPCDADTMPSIVVCVTCFRIQPELRRSLGRPMNLTLTVHTTMPWPVYESVDRTRLSQAAALSRSAHAHIEHHAQIVHDDSKAAVLPKYVQRSFDRICDQGALHEGCRRGC